MFYQWQIVEVVVEHIRRSRREPGPLEYTTSFDRVSKRLGGQQGRAFSTSVLPTFSDIQKNYTVDNPGPGHYKGVAKLLKLLAPLVLLAVLLVLLT